MICFRIESVDVVVRIKRNLVRMRERQCFDRDVNGYGVLVHDDGDDRGRDPEHCVHVHDDGYEGLSDGAQKGNEACHGKPPGSRKRP